MRVLLKKTVGRAILASRYSLFVRLIQPRSARMVRLATVIVVND